MSNINGYLNVYIFLRNFKESLHKGSKRRKNKTKKLNHNYIRIYIKYEGESSRNFQTIIYQEFPHGRNIYIVNVSYIQKTYMEFQ